jgi:hypothetical protein
MLTTRSARCSSTDSTLIGMVTQTDYLDLARRALLGLPLER